MGHWHRRITFKVDIAGIIEIMGTSLYSRVTAPVRELIQNAHDAIMRRRSRDLGYKGRIEVVQDANLHTLEFRDDGIGLTADEAERYLGTLGIGITGLIKRGQADSSTATGDAASLIGQFGIGLFSAFVLADRVVVQTRHCAADQAVRWEAGAGTEVDLSDGERAEPGTTVTLHLKPLFHRFAAEPALLEEAIKEYADFLPIPIFLNGSATRANLINATWFDPTPDREAVELELESFFHETPLDVIPIRCERPAVAGALYITPQRTPGFTSEAVVTATLRRMVVSRHIEGLLPPWASWLRGVLELNDCAPTASREDLVRDATFDAARQYIEETIYRHLETLAERDPRRLGSIIAWHRYTLAGAALREPRLRRLLRGVYVFATSQGAMTSAEIIKRSDADALVEAEAEKVIWYNVDRHQENWGNAIFASQEVPCVHALRSFEEALLATMVDDARREGLAVELRPIGPNSANFAQSILGVKDLEEAAPAWQEFLGVTGAKVFCAGFDPKLPALAFLNERRDLMQSFEELKKNGTIPPGFQRLVDRHFADNRPGENELLLNRRHALVGQALRQSIHHPLASVLRLLAFNALATAGASATSASQRLQADDLDWLAQALAGRKDQPERTTDHG